MTGGARFFYRARRAGAARRPRGAPPNGRRWATARCRSHGVHHRRACGLVLLLEARFKRGCRLAWSDSALSSSCPRRLEARGLRNRGRGASNAPCRAGGSGHHLSQLRNELTPVLLPAMYGCAGAVLPLLVFLFVQLSARTALEARRWRTPRSSPVGKFLNPLSCTTGETVL